MRRKSRSTQRAAKGFRGSGFGDARTLGQGTLECHPDRHGFAMGEIVAAQRLERMSDGVTEVQHLPETTLVLVAGDDPSFDLYAADDNVSERVTPGTARREKRWELPLHELKVTRVRYRAMLNRLGKSRSQKVKWKRGKGLRVGDDGRRGVENPHQILPREGVHPRFPAYRGVDHPEQSGRYLDYRNPPHERPGNKSRDVADHSPT